MCERAKQFEELFQILDGDQLEEAFPEATYNHSALVRFELVDIESQ